MAYCLNLCLGYDCTLNLRQGEGPRYTALHPVVMHKHSLFISSLGLREDGSVFHEDRKYLHYCFVN